MPQERYNATWVQEHGVGIVLDSFKSIRSGVDEVIARFGELRTNVARIDNRAVFEIPTILNGILQASRASALPARDAVMAEPGLDSRRITARP
jgi:hypothetical protein